MFLVDTNVFLEGFLDRNKASSVRNLFRKVNLYDLYVTDFTLHSIGVILFRLKKHNLYISFIKDMIIDGMQVLSLQYQDLIELENVSKKYNLDFDDAYQYLTAEKHNLQIVSFDKDFDNTEKSRIEPANI